jgi:shikimate kinase
MNLVICGMKHCGKSTHGRFIARKLSCPFIDTDELLEAKYFELEKNPLNSREIYNLNGEDYFRSLEADVIHSLVAEKDEDKTQVIALGGGVPSNPQLGPELKKLGRFIYIKNEPPVLFKRIAAKGLPKFLQGEKPYEKFLQLYYERERRYIELADLTVEFAKDVPVKEAGYIILAQIEEKVNEWQHLR